MGNPIRFKWRIESMPGCFPWAARTGMNDARLDTQGFSVSLSTVPMEVKAWSRGIRIQLTTVFPDGTVWDGLPGDELRSEREAQQRRQDAMITEAFAAGEDIGNFISEVCTVFGTPDSCEFREGQA